jgi:uncharacterized protein YgiM (DUF1202 family)
MKMNLWLFCGMIFSTGLLAQPASNSPAAPIATPAPALAATTAPGTETAPAAGDSAITNAPAPAPAADAAGQAADKAARKAGAKRHNAAAELRTEPLAPGPAIVEASRVNIRGQAKLNSEIVGHLARGEQVTVLEEINLKNSGPDEPSAWAKILLPANTHVWVSSTYIDAATKTVTPRRLSLRSGPGENYSRLGMAERGLVVKELGTKEGWTEIEAPTNAFAFVAAQYLRHAEPSAMTVPATETAAPAPAIAATSTNALAAPPTEPSASTNAVTNLVANTAANTLAPAPAPAAAEAAVPTNAPATNTVAEAPAAAPTAPAAPVVDEQVPRVVEREGIVRGMTSIQAPSHFELVSPETGKVINYLYTTTTNLDLRRYKGMRIIVAGEEGLDERWGNTPVLKIQRIQVVE